MRNLLPVADDNHFIVLKLPEPAADAVARFALQEIFLGDDIRGTPFVGVAHMVGFIDFENIGAGAQEGCANVGKHVVQRILRIGGRKDFVQASGENSAAVRVIVIWCLAKLFRVKINGDLDAVPLIFHADHAVLNQKTAVDYRIFIDP